MFPTHLKKLKQWFADYTATFLKNGDGSQHEYRLKIVHTHRVCREIEDIASSEGLCGEDMVTAQISALLHDVGRFPQYARYGTFYDLKSEDHALLGLKIIAEHRLLDNLPATQKETIIFAIRGHNQASFPEGEGDPRQQFFARLLRDADKLDIWRVVTDYYRGTNPTRKRAVELDLKDEPDVSEQVYEDLRARRLVLHSHLKTCHDFRLLQLGWVYDINFPRTVQLLKQRGYLDLIIKDLPPTERIQDICRRVQDYLEERIQEKLPG